MIAVLVYYMLFLSVGINIPFGAAMWIYAVVSLALFIPISISGIGVRDVSFVGLLGLYGISSELALTASILLFLFGFIAGIVGGFVVAYFHINEYTQGTKSHENLRYFGK